MLRRRRARRAAVDNDGDTANDADRIDAPPLYWRVLRLRYLRPNGWQRALLIEGVLLVACVIALADLASAWLLIALPVSVCVVVKAHDVLAGWLVAQPAPPRSTRPQQRDPQPTAPGGDRRRTPRRRRTS